MKLFKRLMLAGAFCFMIAQVSYGAGIDLSKGAKYSGIISAITMETGRVFTGMMYVVDSGHARSNDNTSAGNFDTPFDTINYAFDRVTADNSDLILVLAGHTKAAMASADEIDHDVAGVTVWGIGNGSDRPTLTYTAVAGEYTIGANNAIVGNIRFLSSFPDVLKAINIEATVTDAKILNCWFGVDNTGTDEFAECIDLASTNTRTLIANNTFDMGIGNAVQAINLDAVCAYVTIRDNVIRGDYSTANISGDTTLSTNILIEGNLLVNGVGGNLNAQPCIELLTATTGTIRNNDLVCDESGPNAAVVADTCLYFGNRYSETIAGNSTDIPLIGQSYVQVAIKNQAADDGDDLFDVTGGSVIVYALYATCEFDGTQSPVLSLLLDAAVDVVLATGTDTAAVNVDDTITITNGALIINNAGADTAVMLPMVVKTGVIETIKDTGTQGDGVLKWHCVWAPLDNGATVADAP